VTSSGDGPGRVGVACGEPVRVAAESESSTVDSEASTVDSEASPAFASVSAYGESVLDRELDAGLTRLDAEGDLSEREREVVAAMAARIVGGVLPGPRPVRASDVDAATVRELFAVDD